MNLNSAGITRINITDKVSGRGAWRFAESRPLQSIADALYYDAFAQFGMPLMPGRTAIDCTSEEFTAGYDKAFGIDLLLRFTSGMQATAQEKFLMTGNRFTTVTVEYYQDWRTEEPGDWFRLRVDYYFVGYHQRGMPHFDKWILLDWPAVQRATSRNLIAWRENRNMRDGARASFRYANFWDFPAECVIGGYWEPHSSRPAASKQDDPYSEYEELLAHELELDVLRHEQQYLHDLD